VQNPGGLVYVTTHWHSSLWVSINNVNTNPKGYLGVVGSPGVYVNDGGSGHTCVAGEGGTPSQKCGHYPTGTWDFLQSAITDGAGKATVAFQQIATPSTTVYWTPQYSYITVSSVAYGGAPTNTPTSTPTFTPTNTSTPTSTATLQSSAGTLTCFAESTDFDCVQIDAYTVRWNVIDNPYNNSNITGQFSVQNPGGLVYVTAHWNASLWVSAYGVNTNPKGYFGIVGLSSAYVNDGGSGHTCGAGEGGTPSQKCGHYPIGTWNFLQSAVTNAFGEATVGFQQFVNPATTVYWTPQEAYIIVSSVAYGGIPTSTPTNTVTSTPTITPTATPAYPPYLGSGHFSTNELDWCHIGTDYFEEAENAVNRWDDDTDVNMTYDCDNPQISIVYSDFTAASNWAGKAYICNGEGICDNSEAINTPYNTCSVWLNSYYIIEESWFYTDSEVQKVIMHELGHCFSLYHSTDPTSVMGNGNVPNATDIMLVNARH
jgi:hypothetical protein